MLLYLGWASLTSETPIRTRGIERALIWWTKRHLGHIFLALCSGTKSVVRATSYCGVRDAVQLFGPEFILAIYQTYGLLEMLAG